MSKKKKNVNKSINKNSNKGINIILIILIIGCVGILCYLLFLKNDKLIPDYASDVIDTNAIKEEDSNVKSSDGSGSVNLSFSDTIIAYKDTKSAKLYFKNPGTSSANIVLYLIIRQDDKEVVLGKSDLIPAGYAIYQMNLNDISDVTSGGYDGILKTVYYNTETNAREMIDSEIEVSIEVK